MAGRSSANGRTASAERRPELAVADERKHGPDDRPDRDDAADEKLYTSEPLDTGDGEVEIQQQNVGRENEEGGGEWPDPRTPPRRPAPGAD